MKAEDLKEKTKESLQSLETLLDRMALKAHLGGKEAQDALEDIKNQVQVVKTKLNEFSKNAKETTDSLHLESHLALMEVHDRWDHMKAYLEDVSQHIKHQAQKSHSQLQHAHLQSHLAKLEAKEFFVEKADLHRHSYQKAKHKIQDQWYGFLAKFNSEIAGINKSLPI